MHCSPIIAFLISPFLLSPSLLSTTALRSGTTWSRTVYRDYKKFSGLLFPTRIRFNDEGFDISATVKSLTVNDLDPATFALPKELRDSAKN